MRAAALALPALLCSAPAMARFAPPENRPLRYLVTDERGDAGAPIITRSERRVTFRRDGAGWRADLTVLSVDMTGPSTITGMAGHVMKVLTGRTIAYRLDREGKVIDVEDQDTLIADMVTAFRTMAAPSGGDTTVRGPAAARIAQIIAAAPPPAQRAILASLLTVMIAADRTEATPGGRDVSVPAAALGKPVSLAGRETVVRSADRVTITVRAEGGVAGAVAGLSDSPAPPVTPMIRIVERRDIDAATGLVLASERTSESWINGKSGARDLIRTTATLTPVS